MLNVCRPNGISRNGYTPSPLAYRILVESGCSNSTHSPAHKLLSGDRSAVQHEDQAADSVQDDDDTLHVESLECDQIHFGLLLPRFSIMQPLPYLGHVSVAHCENR